MATNNFAALVEELGAFLDARDAGRMLKAHAGGADWVAERQLAAQPAVRRQAEVARKAAARKFDADLGAASRMVDVMSKAMPAVSVAPQRQRLANAYASFRRLADAGRFSVLQTVRLEEQFKNLAGRV